MIAIPRAAVAALSAGLIYLSGRKPTIEMKRAWFA
jgi:hypothetical protein